MKQVELFNPIQTNSMSCQDKIKNLLWSTINATLFRWSPRFTKPCKLFRVWLVRLFGAKVDWTCNLHPKCKIEYPWNLTMGAYSSLGERTWAYAMAPILIGEKCCIGNDVYLLTGSHDVDSKNFILVTRPIIIQSCTWIATGAYILPGVTLEEGSVISAKSLVSKEVIAWTVVGGNPAKFIKKRIIKE